MKQSNYVFQFNGLKCGRVCCGSILLVLFMLLQYEPVLSQDWTEFRGPNGVGHSSAENVPTEWTEDNFVWRTPIEGLGWSSPAVSGDMIWLTTADEEAGTLSAVALDLKTGKPRLAKVVFEKKLGRIHKKNSHASPTAIIDGEFVFVHFGDYGTACLDTSGKVLWKKEMPYGHFHGPGGSPVVVDDKLIVSCDGGEFQFLIALNKKTGEEIWKTPKRHIHPARNSGGKMKPIAFSTPTIRRVGKVTELVVCGADHIAGFDAESGKERWWAGYDGYSIVPRPIFYKDMVFYSSCYNSPVLYGLKITAETGELTESIQWELKKGAPHNPTPLIVDDLLYVVSDRGIAQCLDPVTGQVHWQQRMGRAYSASPIFVDGSIYFQDETGGTTVISPGKTYQELAKNKVSGRTLATPVPISGGILMRTDSELIRIGE